VAPFGVVRLSTIACGEHNNHRGHVTRLSGTNTRKSAIQNRPPRLYLARLAFDRTEANLDAVRDLLAPHCSKDGHTRRRQLPGHCCAADNARRCPRSSRSGGDGSGVYSGASRLIACSDSGCERVRSAAFDGVQEVDRHRHLRARHMKEARSGMDTRHTTGARSGKEEMCA
jgi:hypothetical protein